MNMFKTIVFLGVIFWIILELIALLTHYCTEKSLRKQRKELMETNNDLQMIDSKTAPVNNIYVDPDMIPFNDLQMTPEQHLALKLLIRYNMSVEDAFSKSVAFFKEVEIQNSK